MFFFWERLSSQWNIKWKIIMCTYRFCLRVLYLENMSTTQYVWTRVTRVWSYINYKSVVSCFSVIEIFRVPTVSTIRPDPPKKVCGIKLADLKMFQTNFWFTQFHIRCVQQGIGPSQIKHNKSRLREST